VDTNQRELGTLIGLALVGGSITGVASLTAALLAFSSGDYAAMGLCMVAVAMSFGLLASAVLRQ
jgi:hypothetical protein